MGKKVRDTAEQIKQCLNCKRPKCNDCISGKNAGQSVNGEEFMKLYNSGCTDGEMAKALGVCKETVAVYRRSRDLPVNREGRSRKNG